MHEHKHEKCCHGEAELIQAQPVPSKTFTPRNVVIGLLVAVVVIGTPSAMLSNEGGADLTLWNEYSAAVAAQRVCPGSPSKTHAKCSLSITVNAPCTTALHLVHGRVRGENGWTDCKAPKPGVYVGAGWSAARTTGNGEFTDKLGFRFNPLGVGGVATGTCKIVACSERQVDGKTDYSNNFCNLQNLYGHESGLKVLELDVTGCPQHDVKECCKFRDQKRPSLFTFGR